MLISVSSWLTRCYGIKSIPYSQGGTIRTLPIRGGPLPYDPVHAKSTAAALPGRRDEVTELAGEHARAVNGAALLPPEVLEELAGLGHVVERAGTRVGIGGLGDHLVPDLDDLLVGVGVDGGQECRARRGAVLGEEPARLVANAAGVAERLGAHGPGSPLRRLGHLAMHALPGARRRRLLLLFAFRGRGLLLRLLPLLLLILLEAVRLGLVWLKADVLGDVGVLRRRQRHDNGLAHGEVGWTIALAAGSRGDNERLRRAARRGDGHVTGAGGGGRRGLGRAVGARGGGEGDALLQDRNRARAPEYEFLVGDLRGLRRRVEGLIAPAIVAAADVEGAQRLGGDELQAVGGIGLLAEIGEPLQLRHVDVVALQSNNTAASSVNSKRRVW